MGLTDADLVAIRRDFPPLQRLRRGKPPIYLNNTCMTLRPRSVIEAVRRYYEEFPTCGGGRTEGGQDHHNWFLGELKEREEAARESVRALVNAASADEIVWTRNTTEAMNLVSRGLRLAPGDRVLMSEREHNSTLVPWLEAERRVRAEAMDPRLVVVEHFDLAEDGSFDVTKALAAIGPRTRVVALAQASNLDGTVVPDEDVAAIARAVHAVGGLLVVDGAQSVPHRPVDVRALGVDLLALSVHKMCGPSGMGVLYGRADVLDRLEPVVVGGDTVRDTWFDRVEYKRAPGRFEAGLQDYAGICATAPAVEYVTERVGYDAIREHEHALNAHLTARLAPLEGDHFWILGPKDPAARGGVLTMSSPVGSLLNAIERLADEESNVMLRKGMFCVNSYLHARFDATGSAKNNLRASMYFYNTIDEVETLAKVVERVVRDPMKHLDDE